MSEPKEYKLSTCCHAEVYEWSPSGNYNDPRCETRCSICEKKANDYMTVSDNFIRSADNDYCEPCIRCSHRDDGDCKPSECDDCVHGLSVHIDIFLNMHED